MNSTEAKKLSLPDIMSRLGYEPERIVKGGREYWYRSPFREEKEASFHTSYLGGKWIWNDFGDTGGTVIDFVMRHQNYPRVGQALSFLEEMYKSKSANNIKQSNLSFSFQQQQSENLNSSSTLHLNRVTSLDSTKQYICGARKIDVKVAEKYLEEVYFYNKQTEKEYFAAGIKNRVGGYEIRNPYFKSSIGGKDITFIKGSTSEKVVIFEGFIDYLSYLTDVKQEMLSEDTIILNSASFQLSATKLIEERAYELVMLFLDNDTIGRKLVKQFKNGLDCAVSDCSFLYASHKDYNTYLVSKKS